MKKLLSIMLTVCMLLTLIAVPVSVNALEASEADAYAKSTLGAYYKFTFAEDDLYNYVVSGSDSGNGVGQATYKNNTFYPLWTDTKAANVTAGYKQVTDVDTGIKYDTLQIAATSGGILFTPLTKEGKPFELTPGKQYQFSIKAFNPAAACWTQMFVSSGGNNDKTYGKFVDGQSVNAGNGAATEKKADSHLPAISTNGIGVVGGSSWHLNLKDGTYGVAPKTYTCLHKSGVGLETCTHGDKSVSAYTQVTKYLAPFAEEKFVYDSVNKSFSADLATYTKTGDEYTATGSTTKINNYLTLHITGGNANAYAKNDYPFYGNVTAEEAAQTAPTVWQIESIEVWEVGVGTVNFHESDSVKTVTGTAGDAVALYAPVAPKGKYFVDWYTDEALTKPLTAAPTYTEGAPLELYAKFAAYGSIDEDFETGFKYVGNTSTAIQYTSAGFKYPLTGYSMKNSYLDEIKWHLNRAGLSTTFPAGTVAFYSQYTWGQPGCVMLANSDGTLFVPENGGKYKITYKYRAPLYNGNGVSIKVVYGIPDSFAGKTTTVEKQGFSSALNSNWVGSVVSDWTEKTVTVTIPAAGTGHVPSLGLNIDAPGKTKVLKEDGVTVEGYEFTLVELDYIKVEKIPTYKVNFVNGGNTTTTTFDVGQKITYPTLAASFNYDYCWSLSQTEYVAPPAALAADGDEITVYAVQFDTLSFENYPVYAGHSNDYVTAALPFDGELNSQVSSDMAYTGTKSMKFKNHEVSVLDEEPSDWSTNWKNYFEYNAETDRWSNLTGDKAPDFVAKKFGKTRGVDGVEKGMTVVQRYTGVTSPGVSFNYKISFKYYATAANTQSSKIQARVFPHGNIWWGRTNITGSFTFPAGATDGWQTAEMYVSAKDAYPGSNSDLVLDLQWIGHATRYTNEIYIDDVVITKDFVNTPAVIYHDGETVTKVTDGVTSGAAYTLNKAPADTSRFFKGWADENGNIASSITMPDATKQLCVVNVYARYQDYVKDGDTVNMQYTSAPVNQFYDGKGNPVTPTEGGWAYSAYSADGKVIGKGNTGNAYGWNPNKTDGLDQYNSSHGKYIISEVNNEIGTVTTVGWGAGSIYNIRDKDGNYVVPKANTKYAIAMTYTVLGEGSMNITLGADRKASTVSNNLGANGANDAGSLSNYRSSSYNVQNEQKTGETVTHTFYITTGDMSASIPMFIIHFMPYGFKAQRVADVNGVKSYEVNGKTYYPYEVIDVPRVAVKEISIVEIDSGNVVVTYNRYEEGKGFTPEIRDAKPGTPLVDTQNVDKYWYDMNGRNGNSTQLSVYPNANATYVNADYYMAKTGTEGDIVNRFATGLVPQTVDGKYALKYSFDTAVNKHFRVEKIQDGHTYKFTASFKADAMNANLTLKLATSAYWNYYDGKCEAYSKTLTTESVTTGEWTTLTFYYTADAIGAVQDETETGVDYTTNSYNYSTLYVVLSQSAAAENTVYLADLAVEDLGVAITKGGASVLTAEAAATAKQQAIRYYFGYNTTDGSTITLGGETFRVIERGFIYKDGKLNKDVREKEFTATTNGVKKTVKNSNFNTCWAYNEGVMTFSTYITGFAIGDTTKKLQVKAFLLIEDANGNRFYIHSDSINRTVAGVGAGTDGDINTGA